ncbi:MAG: efflux RND transporter periplasmic adaptor subunit, partial [Candidatus Krumholzibacteriaceae bacterium]
MNRHLFPTFALAVLVVLFGCSKKASDEETGASRSPVVEVKAVPIVKGDIEDAIAVEGKTDVVRREKIISPIAGVAISVRKTEGARVGPGDTLAVIRSGESQGAIDGANALLRAARTEAQKKEAQRSYDLALSTQNAVAICCTSGGVVASRGVNLGEFMSEGAELFTITDLSSIYFAADIPLKTLSQVHAGASCRVGLTSVPGLEIAAVVGAIEPSADLESQSVKAHLVFGQLTPEERSLMKTDMFGS